MQNNYHSIKRLKKKHLYFLANKLIQKILDLHNAKELHQSFIRKKKAKSVKQPEIITYQPKTFEKSNTVDIKSVITEHKLSKTVKQAEKIGSKSSL